MGDQRGVNRDAEAFKEFIEEANLIGMETANGCFKWSNKRGGQHQVASRLDIF